MSIRTYSELITIPTYKERFEYLRLAGSVGQETFGFDRYLNQLLYQRNQQWKEVRDWVIIRDNGCDLAMDGYEIHGERIIVHHMNPVTMEQIMCEDESIFDPEFLISTKHMTHNAIHYGDARLLMAEPIVRTRNDTCPWRHD